MIKNIGVDINKIIRKDKDKNKDKNIKNIKDFYMIFN